MTTHEPLAHIRHVGLDLAFGLGPIGPAEAQAEAVVVGRGERFRMEAALATGERADVLAYDRPRAVVRDLARDTAEVGEGGAVVGPEADEVLRAGEANERVARMAEHHVEAVQRQLQPGLAAKRRLVRPIHLRLVAGRRLAKRSSGQGSGRGRGRARST